MRYIALCLVVVSPVLLVACGGGSSSPAPTPMNATSLTGTWAGTASDSTTAANPGTMMGQGGMGEMTWRLTQAGNQVTGTVAFANMAGGMPGTVSGTMDADDMPFTLQMPMGSMMSAGCSVTTTGTAHVNRTTVTMTATYTGSNACSGAFTAGHMSMARQ